MVNARQRGTSAAYLMNPQRNAATLYGAVAGGRLRSALAGIALHLLQVWSGAERGSSAAALCFCKDGGQDEPEEAELGRRDAFEWILQIRCFVQFSFLLVELH